MRKFVALLVIVVALGCWRVSIYKKQEDINWQFFVENQVGAESLLNVGKNLTFDDEFIYFSDDKNTIYSLSQKNGQINWTSELYNHSPFQVSQDDDSLYIASFDSHIYKLNKQNGYIIWSFTIPNQYWPDTKVFFDENDQYVFFADRGGFLYALDKNTGHEVWKKEFETIDNSKTFQEGSIHFGFLKQSEDLLVVDHFPSKTVYMVNKDDGAIVSQEQSSLKIDLHQPQDLLFFDKYNLVIKQNVIDQPIFNLFDKKQNLIWSYQTKRKINIEEIYQYKNRIFYLDINNQILSSIVIDDSFANNDNFHKVNFQIEESFSSHGPFNVNPNPHIRYQKKDRNWNLKIKEKMNHYKYLLSNLNQLTQFSMDIEKKSEFLEFSIFHQDNFYKNKFNQIIISGEFINKSNQEKVEVNGFYYDRNTWKLRAKLDSGQWQYKIKIKTPFWSKNFKGVAQVDRKKQPSLSISNKSFVLDDTIFFPLGLQHTFFDTSKDGNPLNKIGYAFSQTPATERDDYRYLSFEDYLELHQVESTINMLRYGPDNWAPSIWKNLESPKQFEMDINGNLHGDFIVEEAKKREYKTMMSIFGFYPPHSSQAAFVKKSNREVLKKYLDYVIARYAALTDIWEIANEAVPSLEWQNFISDYLLENDPYRHPVTTSLEEPKLNNSKLLSIHYVTKAPLSNQDLVDKITSFNSRHGQEKAKIISEFCFKEANHFENSADWLRKFSWVFTFQKTGLIFWDVGFGLYENLEAENSNVYVGPEERSYLKILNSFLPPINISATSKFYLENEGNLAVYELEDKNNYLFYLLKLNSLGRRQKLPVEIKKSGFMSFIDPKTGSVLRETSISEGQQEVLLPSFKDDLAIKVVYD